MRDKVKLIEEALISLIKEPLIEKVLPNYDPGKYTICILGHSRTISKRKISKSQYIFWLAEENKYNLSLAINNNFDYDKNNTPSWGRFDGGYEKLFAEDKNKLWGFNQNKNKMSITNAMGVEIYNGTLKDFVAKAHGTKDSVWTAGEIYQEIAPEYFGKGYWILHVQEKNGFCFQATIDTVDKKFDPRKLTYNFLDMNGLPLVNILYYDGIKLDRDKIENLYEQDSVNLGLHCSVHYNEANET